MVPKCASLATAMGASLATTMCACIPSPFVLSTRCSGCHLQLLDVQSLHFIQLFVQAMGTLHARQGITQRERERQRHDSLNPTRQHRGLVTNKQSLPSQTIKYTCMAIG